MHPLTDVICQQLDTSTTPSVQTSTVTEDSSGTTVTPHSITPISTPTPNLARLSVQTTSTTISDCRKVRLISFILCAFPVFWDKQHEHATLLEDVNELTQLWHFKTKPAWPVQGRDTVLLKTVYKSPTTIHVFSFSANDPYLFPSIPPQDPTLIRTQSISKDGPSKHSLQAPPSSPYSSSRIQKDGPTKQAYHRL
ncbi:hypothetical protein P692DRAFT_20872107 [Suillus brevipes Sb2]|nr:hypothetical protein P692DRAFT_20872107 [Suillus brevipes Sb2]